MATPAGISAFALCLAVCGSLPPVAAFLLPGNSCRVSGDIPTSGNSNSRVGTRHQAFAPRQWPPLRRRRGPGWCLSAAEDNEEDEELEDATGKGVYVATEVTGGETKLQHAIYGRTHTFDFYHVHAPRLSDRHTLSV